MNNLVWITVRIEGSQGKVIAYIPGLAQCTAANRETAISNLAVQLGSRVKSIDLAAGKLLIVR